MEADTPAQRGERMANAMFGWGFMPSERAAISDAVAKEVAAAVQAERQRIAAAVRELARKSTYVDPCAVAVMIEGNAL